MTLREDFPSAVAQGLGEKAYQSGLQALKRADRSHIRLTDLRQCGGSADIDNVLKQQQPDAPRWDYRGASSHDIERSGNAEQKALAGRLAANGSNRHA